MIHASRVGLCSKLVEAFPEIEVKPGKLDPPWRGDTDLIVAWFSGYQVSARDIALANPTMTVRYLPTLSKQPAEEAPRDPSPLEQAADAFVAFFDRESQGVGFFAPNVAWQLTQMPEPSNEPALWMVEARLVAYALSGVA